MQNNVIKKEIVDQIMINRGISNLDDASIRDIVRIVNEIEKASSTKFVRMEMGVPGLSPSKVGTQAEIEAIKEGVAQFYPMLEGLPSLADEASKFIKNFMDIDLPANCITPTVGSMQGSYISFMVSSECVEGKNTVLFIDPGFPVQKTQMEVIGKPYETFDIYHYRGNKLEDKLRSYLDKGNIAAIVYSNPNNPSWVCLTDEELRIIGKLSNEYDTIIIEDLAYFAMDFRKDLSVPGKPPYQPTVAKYTDNYFFMISSSKVFNYAGQRLGLLCISEKLFNKHYEHLEKRYHAKTLGYAVVYKLLYTMSSGTSHSPQYAMAAILRAINDGKLNLLQDAREYGERAKLMRQSFKDAGFKIVYEKDGDQDVSDGFYFTISYPGMTGAELAKELLYYGISSITLKNCGSDMEGLRACVSQVGLALIPTLNERIKAFKADH